MTKNRKPYLEKIHGTKLSLFLKDFQNQTHFLLFFSTGLYLLCVAFLIQYLISFLIGLPLITFYPLVTSLLLNLLNIIAWCCAFFGIVPIIFPPIKQKISNNKIFSQILTLILKSVAVWTMLFVPIGTFLGIGVFIELRTGKNQEEKGDNRFEKTSNREWFLLVFIAGFIHAIFGVLIMFLFPFIFSEGITLLFPYLNYQIFTFLIIIGIVSLVSGSLLIICSLWGKKFNRMKIINKKNRKAKFLDKIILISSLLMILIFPIGTFFGLIIIQELYRLNSKKAILFKEN